MIAVHQRFDGAVASATVEMDVALHGQPSQDVFDVLDVKTDQTSDVSSG